MKLILILMGSMLVNNFVMNKFYGCCPFLGVSKRVETAFGMGMAVIFVITVASIVTYFVRQLLVGRRLAEELSALEAEIRERYFALTQKPLIAALKDAANRYRAVEEKGR